MWNLFEDFSNDISKIFFLNGKTNSCSLMCAGMSYQLLRSIYLVFEQLSYSLLVRSSKGTQQA